MNLISLKLNLEESASKKESISDEENKENLNKLNIKYKEIENHLNKKILGLFISKDKNEGTIIDIKSENSGTNVSPSKNISYANKHLDIHIADKLLENFSNKGMHINTEKLILSHDTSKIILSKNEFNLSSGSGKIISRNGNLTLDNGIIKIG